jgi:hypothetical protein
MAARTTPKVVTKTLRLHAEDLRCALEAAEAVESAAQGAGQLKAATFTIAGTEEGDSDYTLVYNGESWHVTVEA